MQKTKNHEGTNAQPIVEPTTLIACDENTLPTARVAVARAAGEYSSVYSTSVRECVLRPYYSGI
jgi:hypothetical protein